MTTLLTLPDEVLLFVVDKFILPDLYNLALSCRRLYQFTQPHLATHTELKRIHCRLDDPFQRHAGGWLHPLISLLKGDFPSEYVEEVRIAQAEWYWDDLPAYEELQEDGVNRRTMPCSPADIDMVVAAIEESPWISQDDACGQFANARDQKHFIAEVKEGDQDNILAVLLPLLPNLRRLYLPKEIDSDGITLGSVLGVVDRIAQKAAAASIAEMQELPFSKLQQIDCVRSGVYPYVGRDLYQMSHLMSLPSVTTIRMGETWEHEFTWPSKLPKSNVTRVEFVGGNVQYEAVKGLAAGMAGPCTFRHRRRSRVGPVVFGDSRWTLAVRNERGDLEILEKEPQDQPSLLSRLTRVVTP